MIIKVKISKLHPADQSFPKVIHHSSDGTPENRRLLGQTHHTEKKP